jgi:hypothetical protein
MQNGKINKFVCNPKNAHKWPHQPKHHLYQKMTTMGTTSPPLPVSTNFLLIG